MRAHFPEQRLVIEPIGGLTIHDSGHFHETNVVCCHPSVFQNCKHLYQVLISNQVYVKSLVCPMELYCISLVTLTLVTGI